VSANLVKKLIIAVIGLCLVVWMLLLVRSLTATPLF
jgi:hypothetical protein